MKSSLLAPSLIAAAGVAAGAPAHAAGYTQTNHPFALAHGLRGWFTPDPVAFYRTQANRLRNAGL